jgi:hypothetical protein
VLGCAAGAGLALWAGSRVWQVTTRPGVAPLPPRQVDVTGIALTPWLGALGWVALAGAGALLATRGAGRLAVGGLLAAAGLGIAGAGAVGLSVRNGVVAPMWPVLAVLGGAAVAMVGVVTLRRGRAWPAMGSRYERAGRTPAADGAGLWEALDRGEDPTA